MFEVFLEEEAGVVSSDEEAEVDTGVAPAPLPMPVSKRSGSGVTIRRNEAYVKLLKRQLVGSRGRLTELEWPTGGADDDVSEGVSQSWRRPDGGNTKLPVAGTCRQCSCSSELRPHRGAGGGGGFRARGSRASVRHGHAAPLPAAADAVTAAVTRLRRDVADDDVQVSNTDVAERLGELERRVQELQMQMSLEQLCEGTSNLQLLQLRNAQLTEENAQLTEQVSLLQRERSAPRVTRDDDLKYVKRPESDEFFVVRGNDTSADGRPGTKVRHMGVRGNGDQQSNCPGRRVAVGSNRILCRSESFEDVLCETSLGARTVQVQRLTDCQRSASLEDVLSATPENEDEKIEATDSEDAEEGDADGEDAEEEDADGVDTERGDEPTVRQRERRIASVLRRLRIVSSEARPPSVTPDFASEFLTSGQNGCSHVSVGCCKVRAPSADVDDASGHAEPVNQEVSLKDGSESGDTTNSSARSDDHVWDESNEISAREAPNVGRRRSGPFSPETVAEVHVNDVVKFYQTNGRVSRGTVLWTGRLKGRKGHHLGLQLDESTTSKHDGTYRGRRYFKSKENHGVFVSFNKIVMVC